MSVRRLSTPIASGQVVRPIPVPAAASIPLASQQRVSDGLSSVGAGVRSARMIEGNGPGERGPDGLTNGGLAGPGAYAGFPDPLRNLVQRTIGQTTSNRPAGPAGRK